MILLAAIVFVFVKKGWIRGIALVLLIINPFLAGPERFIINAIASLVAVITCYGARALIRALRERKS